MLNLLLINVDYPTQGPNKIPDPGAQGPNKTAFQPDHILVTQ